MKTEDLKKIYDNAIRVASIKHPGHDLDELDGVSIDEDGNLTCEYSRWYCGESEHDYYDVDPKDFSKSDKVLKEEHQQWLKEQEELKIKRQKEEKAEQEREKQKRKAAKEKADRTTYERLKAKFEA